MNKLKLTALAIISLLVINALPAIATISELTITEISPGYSYSNTDFNFVMKVTGNGFVEGTTMDIYYPTSGFTEPTIESLAVISTTELRANIEIAFNTYAGFYNIKLTSPDGGTSFIKESSFELKKKSGTNLFWPVISSVTPPNVPEGEERNLIMIGEQFAGDNPLVRLIQVDGPEYFDIPAVRLNHQEINATVPNIIPIGVYDVLVRGTGGYGGNQYIVSNVLTVEPAPEPEPPIEEDNTPEDILDDSDDSDSLSSDYNNLQGYISPMNVPSPPSKSPDNIPPTSNFDYRASFIDQSGTVDTGADGMLTHIVQASRGYTVDMWIQFKNTSYFQWWFKDPLDPNNIHEIRLGLTKDNTSPFTHDSWISTNRITKIVENTLPGEITTLNFKLFIPTDIPLGNYKLSVGLVAEWITWIYDDVHWEIQVS